VLNHEDKRNHRKKKTIHLSRGQKTAPWCKSLKGKKRRTAERSSLTWTPFSKGGKKKIDGEKGDFP